MDQPGRPVRPRAPRPPGAGRPARLDPGPPPRSPRTRLLAAGAVAVAVAAVAAVVWATALRGGPEPTDALNAYLTAWSSGDDRAAARETDRPAAAQKALTASRRGLDGARVRARLLDIDEDGDAASARIRVSWRVPRVGAFRYNAPVRLARDDDRWRIRWSARTVHPALDDESRLGTVVDAPDRGDILDRAGKALVTERAVVDVAVDVDRVKDPAVTARRIAELLDDVDGDALESRIKTAGRGRFLPVITLRRPDFRAVEDRLAAVPGISLADSRAPLAPSRDFARAVLGTVGPITAEQLEAAGDDHAAGDEIGQSGLARAFEERLAGTATRRVVTRFLEDGAIDETLLERPGRRGRSLRITLERGVQAAAETALGDTDGNAALVVVQPSTGDVLAVANRPSSSALNRAFQGLYPPGSTFKIVTTAALLRDGLDVDEVVPCPRTRTVEGKAFRNFEGSAAGEVPFRTDFAQSCNTAFVSLAERLDPDALTATARDFGLGRKLDLGLPAAEGKVPPARDAVGRAAMMIGQDRILASPLQMAGVAATVADGRWRAPRLVAGDERRAGDRLDEGEAQTLRSLMGEVVDRGTGTALAGVAGEVAGKSGTAEYGGGDPPPTHAWFVALRGDLALSVLVEGGESGGRIAAPVAARFFAALDARPE